MKQAQHKKFLAALLLLSILSPSLFGAKPHSVSAWKVPEVKAQSSVEIGAGCPMGGISIVGGIAGGMYVPVCEVNPRIVEGFDVNKTFLDDLFGLFGLNNSGLTDILGSGRMPGVYVPDGSILGNVQDKNTFDMFDMFIFRVLLAEFKLKIIDTLVNQIVAWITGKDTSGPQFIQNWESFLTSAYDIGFLSAGRDLQEAEICPEYKSALINSYWAGSSKFPLDEASQFIRDMNCSLDPLLEDMGSSRKLFRDDFRNGGWLAYAEQLHKPQNTYYGALFKSLGESQRRAASKQNAAQSQGLASNGYLPIKRCDFPFGAPPEECLRYEVTSPASVFESALDASIKSRFDFIVNADQFLELLVVVVDSFINKLIGAGIGGLLEYGVRSEEPGSGYIPKESIPKPGDVGTTCISNNQCNTGLTCQAKKCAALPPPPPQ